MATVNLKRERQTVERMIAIYCHRRHGTSDGLCPECRELRDYANQRVDKCPFRDDNPVCSKCTVHCYKPVMRERIRHVMCYAGPRMLLEHPILAAFHLLHRFKTVSGKRF
jgi:hypothetical protein